MIRYSSSDNLGYLALHCNRWYQSVRIVRLFQNGIRAGVTLPNHLLCYDRRLAEQGSIDSWKPIYNCIESIFPLACKKYAVCLLSRAELRMTLAAL
ncbi:hypothetical protein BTUL_0085g00430 [Botrytis tulipae]|uniref:Uncharacterized protein n=1 Tax=Botrytis tulipae TaxID=87230 RepID=A0A4Z1ETZ8_9HELO|nr:hypothetical protein BTUL_0085g00430 [Botrytis tulipae]